MRISDWSSDVCSSDLCAEAWIETPRPLRIPAPQTVASCAEAWIETYLLMRSDDRRRSPPARRRGSKRLTEARGFLEAKVASCAEAWVDTYYHPAQERKSDVEGKSVSARVELSGRRIIKKKKQTKKISNNNK